MDYKQIMRKCIKLAKKGEGKTSPNPLVGCVVLDKNGNEISTGYHAGYGLAHAEADALSKLKQGQAQGGTLIVNLEPCSHYGKTPPCADLIIKHGIKKLVIAMQDPNPLVSGDGIKKCKDAGIEIIENVLQKEANELNEIFIKNMTEKTCFTAIKIATTIDGKIATKTGDSKWITSQKARNEVQKIRNHYDAILTTSSTILKDDPSMTCRAKNGRNPARIILDRELKTDFSSKIYKNNCEKTYIVIDKNLTPNKTIPQHIEIIKCPVYNSNLDLKYLFNEIYKKGIKSVLVEAGGKLNGELVSLELADKIYHFVAPKILADNDGVSAFEGRNINKISDTLNYELKTVKQFLPDFLAIYKIKPGD